VTTSVRAAGPTTAAMAHPDALRHLRTAVSSQQMHDLRQPGRPDHVCSPYLQCRHRVLHRAAFRCHTGDCRDQWAGETFLSDYSQLKLVEGREGRDYVYVAPESKQWIGKYRSVLLDQPEVFIASDSPYRGAKPDDLAAIAGMLRSTAAGALQQRGYRIVDQPAADASMSASP